MRITKSCKYFFSEPRPSCRNSAHIKTAVSGTVTEFVRILIVTPGDVINSTLVQKSILSKLLFELPDVLIIVETFFGSIRLGRLLFKTFELLWALLLVVISRFIVVDNLMTILSGLRFFIFQTGTRCVNWERTFTNGAESFAIVIELQHLKHVFPMSQFVF